MEYTMELIAGIVKKRPDRVDSPPPHFRELPTKKALTMF
jgi:hypothetical protein